MAVLSEKQSQRFDEIAVLFKKQTQRFDEMVVVYWLY